MAELYGKMAEALVAGNIEAVSEMTQEALDSKLDPEEILSQGTAGGHGCGRPAIQGLRDVHPRGVAVGQGHARCHADSAAGIGPMPERPARVVW